MKILSLDSTCVNCRGEMGNTPLILASGEGHLHFVELLLSQGAEISLTNECGEDALFCASMKSRNGEVIRLLLSRGALVDRSNNMGRSPLVEAASAGDEDNIRALLDYRPDVNHATNDDETPLTFAIVNGTTTAVRMLIEAGADVNRPDRGGWTPLFYAVIEKHPEQVQALLSANADATHRDRHGVSPLIHAISTGCIPIIVALAHRSSREEVIAATEYATQRGTPEIVDILLKINMSLRDRPDEEK